MPHTVHSAININIIYKNEFIYFYVACTLPILNIIHSIDIALVFILLPTPLCSLLRFDSSAYFTRTSTNR